MIPYLYWQIKAHSTTISPTPQAITTVTTSTPNQTFITNLYNYVKTERDVLVICLR